MKPSLFYKILLLSFWSSLTLGAVCPTGNLKVSSFPTLTGDDFTDASQGYDAMYEIKHDPATGGYILHGYLLSQVENTKTAYFSVKEIVREAQQTWVIDFISQPGNCIIIRDRPYLYLYQTSQDQFILKQTLSIEAYKLAQASDDCSIVRVWLEGGEEKVYVTSKETTEIVFPKDSIFDFYYDYGIDSSKTLKKGSLNGITSVDIGTPGLEDTPVSILNRKDINTLILLTKSSSIDQYTVTVVDTLTDTKVYTRSWTKDSYKQKVQIELSLDWNFFMVQDIKGFLLLLSIKKDLSSKVVVQEITLQKPDYTSIFAQSVVVSLDNNAIIAYVGNKLVYFQAQDDTLYFLTEIQSNLEQEALKYEDLSSDQAPVIPTFIEPSEYKHCYYKFSQENNEEIAKEQIENEERSVVQDSAGNVIKCQPECLSCKIDGKCEVCSLGYALSSTGHCVLCSGCRSCFPDTPETCLSCFKPYVLNQETDKCQKSKCTELYCLSCYSNGTCQECFKGYSIFNGKCLKCREGCSGCVTQGSGECDIQTVANASCKVGFVFSPKSVKYPCVECATGCTSCSITDISNCTSCNQGFYTSLTENNVNRCLACMDNCRSCTAENSCEKCLPGYRLSSNSSRCIQKCDATCLTCSQMNSSKCLSCFVGTLLQNGQCVADLSCNAQKKCTTCADGHVLSNGECLKCTYTDANCQGCSSKELSVCSICKFGYYMDGYRKCIKCQEACTGCQAQDACFSCNAGYFLARTDDSVTGKCLKCLPQCKTCNKVAQLCTSCQPNYFLDGSKCISNTHIDYTLTVDSPLQQMVNLARKFRTVLIEFSQNYSVDKSKPLALTSNEITINKLKSGSALVFGKMSTYTKEQSEMIAQNINVVLPGTELEYGYSIIGVSSTTIVPVDENSGGGESSSGGGSQGNNTSGGDSPNNNTTPNNNNSSTTPTMPQNTTPSQKESTFISIGIILAIVIPLSVLLIITAIIAIIKLYKRNKQNTTNSNKPLETPTDKVSGGSQQQQMPHSAKYLVDEMEEAHNL